MNLVPESAYQRALPVVFFLFGGALLTSMAVMELSTALIILMALLGFNKSEFVNFFTQPSRDFLVLLGLVAACVFSLVINQEFDDFAKKFLWFRWAIVLYSIRYLLSRYPRNILPWFYGLTLGLYLAGLHGIFQYIYNWDLVRWNIVGWSASSDLHIPRIIAFFNLPTTYGYALAMSLFMPLVYLFKDHENFKNKLLMALIFGLGVVNLALTYTRGAWISFAAGLFVFMFFIKRKWLLYITPVGIVAAVLLFIYEPGFKERILSITDTQYYSNSQRIELWKANFAIFKDNPAFGVGMNVNDFVVEEYHKKLGHIENIQSHAHNMYLQFLAGTGLLGFFAAMTFFFHYLVSAFKQVVRSSGEHRLFVVALLSVVVTFMVGCLFDCNFRDSEIRHQLVAIFALILASQALGQNAKLSK